MCVISLGGNALIRRGDKGTIEEQFAHTRACTKQISRMVMDGFRIVITHGNGPIVGNIVIRNEAAIGFLRAGGKEVIITSPELVGEAMEGRAGTRLRAA